MEFSIQDAIDPRRCLTYLSERFRLFYADFRSGQNHSGKLATRVFVLIVAVLFRTSVLAGQVPTVKTSQNDSSSGKQQYLGSDRCDQCHYSPSPRVVRDFAMLTEAKHFIEHDKHSQAFQLLNSERSLQMAKLLGIPHPTQAQQCLSCHANWQKGQEKPPYLEHGVSCESCHGPSSLWDLPHSHPQWRLELPEKKTSLGMVDVRNPERRAEQCFSCHIGNLSEGKFLTHEMYAAGHPPLPGIEIESFIDQMPAHWRTISEKGNFQYREEYLKLNLESGSGSVSFQRTRGVLVGGLVALRESLQLISEQAAQGASEWPELASFDCQACHHDLRSPSWRQERIPLSAPGRPSLPEWPLALVKIGLQTIAAGEADQLKRLHEEFLEQRRKLALALQRQPFGERVAVQEAGTEFVKWLNAMIEALEKTPIDQMAVNRVRVELMTLSDQEFPDFHSARQMVWALGVISEDIEFLRAPPLFQQIPLKESTSQRRNREEENITALLSWRESTLNPRRKKWVDRWSDPTSEFQLQLSLPAGVSKVGETDMPQPLIVDHQPRVLEAISNYDAAKFRKRLLQLRDSE